MSKAVMISYVTFHLGVHHFTTGKWTSEFSYQISTGTEKEETGQFVVFEVQHWVMIEHSQYMHKVHFVLQSLFRNMYYLSPLTDFNMIDKFEWSTMDTSLKTGR